MRARVRAPVLPFSIAAMVSMGCAAYVTGMVILGMAAPTGEEETRRYWAALVEGGGPWVMLGTGGAVGLLLGIVLARRFVRFEPAAHLARMGEGAMPVGVGRPLSAAEMGTGCLGSLLGAVAGGGIAVAMPWLGLPTDVTAALPGPIIRFLVGAAGPLMTMTPVPRMAGWLSRVGRRM